MTPLITIDPHSDYNFGYPLFLFLPDLTTEVNYLNDLTKIGFFVKSTADVIYIIHTLHIWIYMNRICDMLNQLRKLLFKMCNLR